MSQSKRNVSSGLCGLCANQDTPSTIERSNGSPSRRRYVSFSTVIGRLRGLWLTR